MTYHKAACDRWRAKPENVVRTRRRNRERNAEWTRRIRELKIAMGGCVDCGYSIYPEALDFDHRPGETKLFNIGTQRMAWDKVLTEIAKCDLVCANCHRHRTFVRNQYTNLEVVFA